MRVISKQRFHELFESKGLILDTRYQPPQTLHFPATPDLRCGWDLPASPKDLPRFVSSMFNACEEDEPFYLYPRAGAWMCGDTLKIFRW